MSTTNAAKPATHDFYGPIHKGLRLALGQLLARLGSVELRDSAAVAGLLADLRAQLALSAAHLQHEDNYVHGALEQRAPGLSDALEDQHHRHRETFAELEALAAALETAEPDGRAAAARALYLRFSQFVAEDFEHMADEETRILPLLQQLFSDAELIEIEASILAATGPEEMIATGRMILPAMRPDERLVLMQEVRRSAPPEGFDALMELAARPSLPETEFLALRRGLGLDLAA